MENVTPADVQMSFGQIMLDTYMGKSLINIGRSYIGSEASSLGRKLQVKLTSLKSNFSAMVSRYFILSGIPMSRITICDEIYNMVSFLFKNLSTSNSNSISEEGVKKLCILLIFGFYANILI